MVKVVGFWVEIVFWGVERWRDCESIVSEMSRWNLLNRRGGQDMARMRLFVQTLLAVGSGSLGRFYHCISISLVPHPATANCQNYLTV